MPTARTRIRSFVDLATNLVARSAVAVATRIAILNNKIGNHAMNLDPVEISATRKLNEVVDV